MSEAQAASATGSEVVELGLAFAEDSQAIVEDLVEGTEITGAVLGNDELERLPLVEIAPEAAYEFFDYEAKYTPGATREICPARLPEEVAETARMAAETAHRVLSCRGYSRTDMMVREDGTVWLLETNTLPGMTELSLFPQAAREAGISFPELLDRLIELALEG